MPWEYAGAQTHHIAASRTALFTLIGWLAPSLDWLVALILGQFDPAVAAAEVNIEGVNAALLNWRQKLCLPTECLWERVPQGRRFRLGLLYGVSLGFHLKNQGVSGERVFEPFSGNYRHRCRACGPHHGLSAGP
jgi:hypothetical protein